MPAVFVDTDHTEEDGGLLPQEEPGKAEGGLLPQYLLLQEEPEKQDYARE